MNEAMSMKIMLELSKLEAMGVEIRDVFLLVNLRDIAGNICGASNIIWVGESSGNYPLTFTRREKKVLLAEVIKKLGISPSDLVMGE